MTARPRAGPSRWTRPTGFTGALQFWKTLANRNKRSVSACASGLIVSAGAQRGWRNSRKTSSNCVKIAYLWKETGERPDYRLRTNSLAKNPYQVLGLTSSASDSEIRAAFRKLAKQYHPDRNAGNKAAEETFKEVSAAFEILGDKEKRRKFDNGEIDADGRERAYNPVWRDASRRRLSRRRPRRCVL